MICDGLSAKEFISVVIALAVALTGWVTLILANRRMRAERAMPVFQAVCSDGRGRLLFEIENVGQRAALDVEFFYDGGSLGIAGGLRAGGKAEVRIVPPVGSGYVEFPVAIEFRDVDGRHHRIERRIGHGAGDPILLGRTKTDKFSGLLVRLGLRSWY